MIRVVFFASIREALGIHQLELDSAGIANAADVIQALRGRGEPWQAVLGGENVLIAVNQTMAEPGAAVREGDEVAFFPPVTGG